MPRPDLPGPARPLARATWLILWLACTAFASCVVTIPLDNDDQSLFRLGARLLAGGADLYSDLWDIKQPGIFWYYQAGIVLFGDAAVAGGVHWLTAAWLGTCGLAAAVLAHRLAPTTIAWWLAPLFTMGFQVMRSDPYNTAQVESLLQLPILLVMVLLSDPDSGRAVAWRRWLMAGLAIGAVAAFKLLLVAVVAAAMLPWLIAAGRRDGWQAALAAGGWCAAGFALAAVAVLMPFVLEGDLGVFLWTLIEHPRLAFAHYQPMSLAKLLTSSLHGLATIALILPLALWQGWHGLRRDVGTQSLLLWLLVALLAILVQVRSWHAYHFSLLYWPVGLLAAIGLGRLAERASSPSGWRGAGRLAATVLVLLGAGGTVINGARFAYRQVAPFATPVDSRRYLATMPALGDALASTDCRSAIVFGPPALLLATDLVPVSHYTGQLAETLVPPQWQTLQAELKAHLPAFLYVSETLAPIVQAALPGFLPWLGDAYRPLAQDHLAGRWYQARATPCTTVLGPARERLSRLTLRD